VRSWRADNGLGGTGILVGGVAGIVRSTTPILFATASGFQWFAVGSTFWGMPFDQVKSIG
jgi:predicted benzoate:H+ symporter BenE